MRVVTQSPGCRNGRSPREPVSGDSGRPQTVLLRLLVFLLLASPARAAIPRLIWESPVAMDAPVPDVSSSWGDSAQHNPVWHPDQWPEEWYVVYPRDGNVYCTTRGASG
jgi:hypothetical protein